MIGERERERERDLEVGIEREGGTERYREKGRDKRASEKGVDRD